MPARKYRVAVVGGAGTWGRYYLQAYAEHPDCEIIGLVDRARDRRQAFAGRYGIETVLDSVKELLSREVPDIVSAIVPVTHNYPTVVACAEAGVRVVSCEKPISAELGEADAMLRICGDHGTLLACGQAIWETPFMPQVFDWVHAGNIGQLTGAAIPWGLPVEVSGGGCVQLAGIRILTGMEVEWVEGWVLPSEPGYVAPPGRPEIEADCPAYGRLGLSGGIVCEISEPRSDEDRPACYISAEGENGHVWLVHSGPVLVQGKGAASTPVFPEFLDTAWTGSTRFDERVKALIRAFETGEDPQSSGYDYRQSLEIAIALKLSAKDGHRRVSLPLDVRSLRLYPHPYRHTGGDVAGWKSIGYAGPPDVV